MRSINKLIAISSITILFSYWSSAQESQQDGFRTDLEKLTTQKLIVKFGDPDPSDCHGRYQSEISITPSYQYIGKIKLHVALKIKNAVKLYSPSTCGGLAGNMEQIGNMIEGKTSNQAQDAMNTPEAWIKEVRAIFDKDTIAMETSDSDYTCSVPNNSEKFEKLEVDWAWQDNEKTFSWEVGNSIPWLLIGVGVVTVGAAGAALKRKKPFDRPLGEEDKIIQGEGTKTSGNDAP
jgi:hypothetical protein